MESSEDRDVLRVSRSLAIPMSELTWSFTASGGPGGQHANTANTKVEVRFDVASSPSLDETQRERLLRSLGSEVRVVASDERSQARNRVIAAERLAQRLAAALAVRTRRVPTRPGRNAVKRRLDAKSKRSQVKRMRGRVDPGD
ncbi:MAG: alternative ribosome rescue aminoacyl-tRNA hydrolase ArfB [Acidimicrobiales bacterium]|nr:alternative ribosome rescue aminoacyl-tRNA hydrolase ArfB [Acidimicrobiales bacterium]